MLSIYSLTVKILITQEFAAKLTTISEKQKNFPKNKTNHKKGDWSPSRLFSLLYIFTPRQELRSL